MQADYNFRDIASTQRLLLAARPFSTTYGPARTAIALGCLLVRTSTTPFNVALADGN